MGGKDFGIGVKLPILPSTFWSHQKYLTPGLILVFSGRISTDGAKADHASQTLNAVMFPSPNVEDDPVTKCRSCKVIEKVA